MSESAVPDTATLAAPIPDPAPVPSNVSSSPSAPAPDAEAEMIETPEEFQSRVHRTLYRLYQAGELVWCRESNKKFPYPAVFKSCDPKSQSMVVAYFDGDEEKGKKPSSGILAQHSTVNPWHLRPDEVDLFLSGDDGKRKLRQLNKALTLPGSRDNYPANITRAEAHLAANEAVADKKFHQYLKHGDFVLYFDRSHPANSKDGRVIGRICEIYPMRTALATKRAFRVEFIEKGSDSVMPFVHADQYVMKLSDRTGNNQVAAALANEWLYLPSTDMDIMAEPEHIRNPPEALKKAIAASMKQLQDEVDEEEKSLAQGQKRKHADDMDITTDDDLTESDEDSKALITSEKKSSDSKKNSSAKRTKTSQTQASPKQTPRAKSAAKSQANQQTESAANESATKFSLSSPAAQSSMKLATSAASVSSVQFYTQMHAQRILDRMEQDRKRYDKLFELLARAINPPKEIMDEINSILQSPSQDKKTQNSDIDESF